MDATIRTMWLSAEPLPLAACLAALRYALAGQRGTVPDPRPDFWVAGLHFHPRALPAHVAPLLGAGPADLTVEGLLNGAAWEALLTDRVLATLYSLGASGAVLVRLDFEPDEPRKVSRPLDEVCLALWSGAGISASLDVRVRRSADRAAAALRALEAGGAMLDPGGAPFPGSAEGVVAVPDPAAIADVLRGVLAARGCRRVWRGTWTARRAPGGDLLQSVAGECRTYDRIRAAGLPAERYALDVAVHCHDLGLIGSWQPLLTQHGNLEVVQAGWVNLGEERWLEIGIKGWADGLRLELVCQQGATTAEVERLVGHRLAPMPGY